MSSERARALSQRSRPMKRSERIAIGVTGLASWAAGAVATFTGGEGSGAVALVGVGAAAGVLGLVGHWPSRIAVSGNEITWDTVEESVDQQIEVAQDAGDETAVGQLEELRRRLADAARTGSLPKHPAADYDEAVYSAMRRLFPGLGIDPSPRRARDRPDFVLYFGERRVLVETKFKSDAASSFSGSTLAPLIASVGESDRLLVVTNSVNVDAAGRLVAQALGARGYVTNWLGPNDDAALQAAVQELLRG